MICQETFSDITTMTPETEHLDNTLTKTTKAMQFIIATTAALNFFLILCCISTHLKLNCLQNL